MILLCYYQIDLWGVSETRAVAIQKCRGVRGCDVAEKCCSKWFEWFESRVGEEIVERCCIEMFI